MKFCSHCGKEIMDEAVICPACGCSVKKDFDAEENTNLITCSVIFAFLIPIVGIILGIIGICKYKTPEYRNRCIAAVILSVVIWIIAAVIFANVFYSYY